ncbi:DJ-1/PfpI family protein [Streptomyces leeuwenhoekii]|jgi:transcriptional regulator GlxA family with amidase domain|uniref:ThiJ/PfpI Domain-Containing Protein n=1 Tax=Streptomyces leeuwenhoekii TaxID=1437453 RepID=A0A0F7VW83_STRLW|nr:DJ-1/PfpI family protein [Streptomyces leeuwenhoekii]CQR61226.1 ThiJ/PfpI Domain-Containing Protein [Streptomyces leeuwenhoekii]
MTTYGLLVFDEVEELDFVGPWEVFQASALLRGGADTAVLVAEHTGPVRCVKGLRVLPDHTLDDHPPLDVVLVPGGRGARQVQVRNPRVTDWLAKTADRADWVHGVCTGAFLLHAAGPARGRRVATHWQHEDELAGHGDVTVVRDARYVVDGKLLTSQGVSAGIDSALWLVGRLHGRDHARAVRRAIQYDPAPPYLADEPVPA